MLRIVSFCLFLLLCCFQKIEAQNIKVESFSRLENDITARVNVVKDANDDECALIKMVTTDVDYDVDERIKIEPRVGEIWFYVPQGTKRIIIRHKKLGKLDYTLPETLEAKTTYQIKLPDNIEIIVHADVGGQYLVMNVEPINATVYIDGVLETFTEGVLSKLLKYGKHTYKVEAPMYQSEEGVIDIGNERKKKLVQLKPDFGFVYIKSVPEQDAVIYFDDVLIGKTPLKTNKISKGIHQIRALLPMYQPVLCSVNVVPEQTTTIELQFIANFATIDLSALPEEEIWINNEYKGKGGWKGRLTPGLYTFEARKNAHRSSKKSIELKAGEHKKIVLDASKPIYGSLNVNTNPIDAKVFIDGKEIGLAPNIFNNILIGKRKIEIVKPGCLSKSVEVNIQEGVIQNLNVSLSVGKVITLKSNLKDAEIYLDQKLVGSSPVSTSLTYATHTIMIKSPAKKLTRTVTVNAETPAVLEFNDLLLGEALGRGWYKSGLYFNSVFAATPFGYGHMSIDRRGCIVGHKLYLLYKTHGQKIIQNGGRQLVNAVERMVEYDLETGKDFTLKANDMPFRGDYKLCLYNGKAVVFSSEDKKAYIYEDKKFKMTPYDVKMKEISNKVTTAVSGSFPWHVFQPKRGESIGARVRFEEMFTGKGFYVVVVTDDGRTQPCYFYVP